MDPLKNFRHPHMDAAENTFLRRQLEKVRERTYDIEYPEFKGRLLVPVDNSVHNGAETVTFDTYDQVGEAEMTADYANDGPAVDVFASSQTLKIFGMLTHYSFNLQEVRAGMMAGGRGLPERKAFTARKAIEQKHDSILLLGESNYGLKGLFTLSGTTTYATPTGAKGSKSWAQKTPDEVLADLNGIVNQIINDTLEVEVPDTLVLPLTALNYIKETRMGDGIPDTIYQYFRKNNDHIKTVESSTRLQSNAAWTGRRMVAYKRDPMKLQGVIPQEFEQLPPSTRGVRTVTVCHSRAAGIELYYPKSVAYGDEI